MMQVLGRMSTLVALADPDQRIYEFRGADPARIQEFITAHKPTPFDFASENHRSNGTDIVAFANDLLSDSHKGKVYKDVALVRYSVYQTRGLCFTLKAAILGGIKRVAPANKQWSIACLVPTKRLMIAVSEYLSSDKDGLPALHHDVAMDQEGPALAGLVIAGLLECGSEANLAARFIADLCTHIRGRRGADAPPQLELDLTGALTGYLETGKKPRGKVRLEIVAEAARIAEAARALAFTGNPVQDWLSVRNLLETSSVDCIRQVADNARFLRLLTRGTSLRDQLSGLWREHHAYTGALQCVEGALRQDHFAASMHEPSGLEVMTIHKSKGKEYDEVFIFEGYKQGKIVRSAATPREIAQARLSLRVATTRARKRATIMFPKSEPCPFF